MQEYVTQLQDSASSEDVCPNLPQFQGLLTASPVPLLSGRPQGRQQPRQAPGDGGGWRRSRRSREAPLLAGSLLTWSRGLFSDWAPCSGLRETLLPAFCREVDGGAASNRDPNIPVLLFSYEVRLEKERPESHLSPAGYSNNNNFSPARIFL